MQYVRLYSGPEGESHFEDVAVALDPVDFAPPAPPLHLSAFLPVARLGFLGPASRPATERSATSRRAMCCSWRTPPARAT